MENTIKAELISIADELDRRGLRQEADEVTTILAEIVSEERVASLPDPEYLVQVADALDAEGRFEESDQVTAYAQQVAMVRSAQGRMQDFNQPQTGAGRWLSNLGRNVGDTVGNLGGGLKDVFTDASKGVYQGAQAVGQGTQSVGRSVAQGAQAVGRGAQDFGRTVRQMPGAAVDLAAQGAGRAVGGLVNSPAYQQGLQQAGGMPQQGGQPQVAGQQLTPEQKQQIGVEIDKISSQINTLRQQGAQEWDPRIMMLHSRKNELSKTPGIR